MRILIVDDDNMICESLKIILEAKEDIDVVGIGKNGYEAISLYNELLPDILLIDIRMDKMTGIEAGEEIIKKHSDAKILYLTTFSDDEYIVRALNIGAKGYILKQNFNSIESSLNSIMAGQSVFGEGIAYKFPNLVTNSDKKKPSEFGITDKELEIITLVSEGLSNKEIANKIFLSEGTVRNYISNILEKLDIRDRTQLVIFYYNYLK